MNAVFKGDVIFVFNGVSGVLLFGLEKYILRKRNRTKFGQILEDFIKCGCCQHSGDKDSSLNFKEFHVDVQPANRKSGYFHCEIFRVI